MTTEKFKKDFEQIMADMKASEDWEEGQKINFEQTGSIMATLGFLPENVAPGKPDYALFEELWAIVDGEDRGGINKEDLAYVLQIIRGITLPEKEVEADAPEGKEGLSKQIVFNADGNLQIRKGGQAKLHKKFIPFYVNKQQAPDYSRMREKRMFQRPETADQAVTSRPEISQKTKRLADKQRSKLQGESVGKRTATAVVQHLLAKEKVRAEQKQKKAEAIQKEKEDEQEFTFKPKTNKYMNNKGATSGDKCLDLYSRVKPKQYMEKNGRSSIDIEYERE